ncbi:MAG TPA: M23 family metallopeptidase [Gemmatimonadaceae bacterium]|nr:M23 family metallopeptidase [Gemmatimonadaceae bacterium]
MTIILAFPSILAFGMAPLQAVAEPADALPAPVVSFTPARPLQGTAVVVSVTLEAGQGQPAGIRAMLAGEPLHFEPDSIGTWHALGAVPIDASGTVHFPVMVELASGGVDTLQAALEIATGQYAMERLTVAPRFGAAPDSALAARMARESARAREVSERSHATPRLWDSAFVRPRDARITSGFGHGREFNGRIQSRHMGVDFAGAVGTPIRAPNRGVVALVDEFYLGGNVVYIDHGAGLVTAYLHLSRQEVAQGDTVERGQIIGRVGATGRVTGPHLHWIARYGRVTIDPLSLTELPALRAREIVEESMSK